jgi:transcription initiation factor TFIID subunit TAF12
MTYLPDAEHSNMKITYKEFKTGFTFNDIRQMLKLEANRKYQRGIYMFITRHTVLGRWHQIKREMYYREMQYMNKKVSGL